MRQSATCLASLLAMTAASLLALTIVAAPGAAGASGEWRGYAGSNAGLKYSPLDQIDKDNVKRLKIAWRQSAMPLEVRRGRGTVAVPTNYQVTPLMVGGLVYATTGDGSVVALNPATGAVVWAHVPPELLKGAGAANDQPPGEMLTGRSANRGLAYWTDGTDARVIAITGDALFVLHAKTGAPVAGFGRGGTIDLTKGYRRPAASMRCDGRRCLSS